MPDVPVQNLVTLRLSSRQEKNIALDDLSLEEYKAVSPVFDEDIYEAISLQTCVDKRLTLGAPGPEVMNKVIAIYDKYMDEN